jgi:hypothetical protein
VVTVKALIFIPVILMVTAVMANGSQVAELEASVSVAQANMDFAANILMNILQKLEKVENYKETTSDGIGGFIISTLYSFSFGKLCGILTNVNNNLGYILDFNIRNGVLF